MKFNLYENYFIHQTTRALGSSSAKSKLTPAH